MITLYDEGGLLEEELQGVVETAADATFLTENKRGAVDIFFLREDDMRMRNRLFRGKDAVTDVLSFPTADAGKAPGDGFWGDILLCPARAKEQAAQYGHTLTREIAFLTVHGMLHLFGYDHMVEKDAACMEERQEIIMERIQISR